MIPIPSFTSEGTFDVDTEVKAPKGVSFHAVKSPRKG